MLSTCRYHTESVLVHELGHSVMNLGMDKQQRDEVEASYQEAKGEG